MLAVSFPGPLGEGKVRASTIEHNSSPLSSPATWFDNFVVLIPKAQGPPTVMRLRY